MAGYQDADPDVKKAEQRNLLLDTGFVQLKQSG
jgi:hypothetical protein